MRYAAFVSYSHADDADLAAAIQSSLQGFARPWYKTRALRVFRDKTGLSANPGLWDSIVAALQDSEYLILLASPLAAKSPWVNQEVGWFLRNRSPDRIFIVVTGGAVEWNAAANDFEWDRTTALPQSLRGAFHEEPFYVDLTWAHAPNATRDARFRDAILDLAAPLHGRAKDDLDSDDLRQHRHTLRIAWTAVALLTALAAALGIAAVYATRQRNLAQQESAIATEQKGRAVEQARIAQQQRQLAEDRRMTALSRQLAAQALAESPVELDRAFLEAVEAYRASPTFEARHALLAMLFYSPHLRQFSRGPRHSLQSAALSRDARTVVALDEDSGNVLVEAVAGSSLQTAGEMSARGKVKSLAISADGSGFATGESGKIVIRKTKGQTVDKTLSDGLADAAAPAVISMSADRTRVAAYESSPGILLWDTATQRLRAPPLRPKRWESALAFSADGTMLASGAYDGSIVLWSADTGQPIGSPLLGHRGRIFGLAFSPDGRILASGSEDRTVILWDVKAGRALGAPLAAHEKWPLGNDSWGLSVAFSPDGRILASAAKDRSVILWDVAERKPIGNPLRGHGAPPMAVAFSADGRSLLSLGKDNVALRWDSDSLSIVGQRVPTAGDAVSKIAFSPDGKLLAAATSDHGVVLWDPDKRTPIGAPLRGQGDPVFDLLFLPASDRLLSAAKGGLVEWNTRGGIANRGKLGGTTDRLSQVAFSPDGKLVAWSDDLVLLLRNGTGAPAHLPIALASPDHAVSGLSFSPDGGRLASGGFDGTLALWDVRSRQLLWPAARAHRLAVQTLAFSPDGKILASAAVGTADFDRVVRLWDPQSGRELPPALGGHPGPVRALAFNSDGSVLAAGTGDRIVFWDVGRRLVLGDAVANDGGYVTSLAFSPDHRWLGSGEDDGAVLWDLRPEVWLRDVCAVANRNLEEHEWKQLFGDNPPYRPSCQ